MTAQILLSATFVRQFGRMDPSDQKRVRAALAALKDDPRRRRAGADIKRLVKTKPTKHRIRVGPWRIVYRIDGDTVRVIEVFARGRGYRA